MRNWILPLPDAIVLPDGRTIASLKDAAEFMLTLPAPSRRNAHWEEAAQRMVQASHSGTASDLEDAVRQLRHALTTDGLC